MYKLKLEGIKGYFDSENEYLDFVYEMDGLWISYMTDYAFLGITEKSWNDMFNKIVKGCLDKNVPKRIAPRIKKVVDDHVKKQIDAKNPRILNNLLILMYHNESLRRKDLLKSFFRRLEGLKIKIDNEYFTKLKSSSKLLWNTLSDLGAIDLNLRELQNLLEQKNNNEYYERFVCRGKSYQEIVYLVDYAVSCFENSKEVKSNLKIKSSDYFPMIDRFIKNYDLVLKIHDLFKREIGSVDDKLIDRVLLNYSQSEWNYCYEQYQRFITFTRDLTFLNRIAGKIGFNKIKFNQRKKENPEVVYMPYEHNVKGLESDRNKFRQQVALKMDSNPIDGMRKKLVEQQTGDFDNKSKRKSLYDRFTLLDGISVEQRKQIVDSLFNEYDEDTKKLINDYLTGRHLSALEIQAAINRINYMRAKYKKHVNQLLEPTLKEPIKRDDRKSMEERFPLQEGMSEEERKKIIEILLNLYDEETKKLIKDYVAGKKLARIDEESVKNKLTYMKHKYRKLGKKLLDENFEAPTKRDYRLILVEKFSLQEDINKDIRKQIVDILFEELFDDVKVLVADYLLGKKQSSEEINKAKRAIEFMQKIYNVEGIKLLNSNLYENFSLNKKIDEEKRKEIVDGFLNELYERKRELGEVSKSLSSEDIISLQEKYSELVEQLNAKSKKVYKKKSLVNRFPLQEGMSEEERLQIINILLNEFDSNIKAIINDYVSGKKLSKIDVRKAKNRIARMRIKYNKYGKRLLDEKFRASIKKGYRLSLAERFPLQEGMSEEERQKLVDSLLNEYDEDAKKVINDYVDGETLSKKDERKALDRIYAMQIKYSKSFKNPDVSDSNVAKKVREKSFKPLVERFPLLDDISKEEREQIVQILLNIYDEDTKQAIDDYCAGKELSNDSVIIVRSRIAWMQRKYRKYGKQLLDGVIKEAGREKLLEIFPLQFGVSEEERQIIVDSLLNGYRENTKKIIIAYINGKELTKKNANNAKNKIRQMKVKYTKILFDMAFYNKKVSLVEMFPLTEEINQDIRQKIVDILFEELFDDVKGLINDYYAGVEQTKNEISIVKNAILFMLEVYETEGIKILNDNLYGNFPLAANINKEERIKIVDYLLEELYESKRKSGAISRRLSIEDINSLQSKYEEMLKHKHGRKKKSLSSYFPLQIKKGMSEEERQTIVEILLNENDENTRKLLDDYAEGKAMPETDVDLVENTIKAMQERYRKYGKNLIEIDKRNKYFQSIILIIKDELSVELEPMSLEKMNVLYDALMLIEYFYRNELGMIKDNYEQQFRQRLIEIMTNGCGSLEDLLVLYINSEYFSIVKAKIIRNRKIEGFFDRPKEL